MHCLKAHTAIDSVKAFPNIKVYISMFVPYSAVFIISSEGITVSSVICPDMVRQSVIDMVVERTNTDCVIFM